MTKVEDYLQNAADCRKLAANADSEAQRREFINIAESWERLADERRRRVGNKNQTDKGASSTEAPEVIDLITGKTRLR